MAIQTAAADPFRADLATMLPRLRIYALSLTRDADRAGDLVQQTAMNALVGRKSFRPGTNFAGWLFRIQRNEFISGLRRVRPTVTIDDTIANALSHQPQQETGIVMRQFKKAFRVLPGGQRKALLMSALEGCPYERIATLSNISVGTVKSRISRGRATLRHMLGDEANTHAIPTHAIPHAAPHAAATA